MQAEKRRRDDAEIEVSKQKQVTSTVNTATLQHRSIYECVINRCFIDRSY